MSTEIDSLPNTNKKLNHIFKLMAEVSVHDRNILIRHVVKNKLMNQSDVARLFGWSKENVSHIIKGEVKN